MEGYTHGETYTEGHTDGRTYTRRDINMEEHTHGRVIYIV